MLKKSVLAISAIALVSITLLWGQDGLRRQQGFTDCDLDIRPNNKHEVQVYWSDVASPQIGMKFQLWAPADNLVYIDFPDGEEGHYLKKGWANTVTFTYSATESKVVMEICNGANPENCPSKKSKEVPVVGDYSEPGAMDTPKETAARPDEDGRERVFISGVNHGLTFSFILRRDLVP